MSGAAPRWYDPPDGWRDRVQAVVCHVFGCACTAAEGASEADDPNPDRGGGEAQPCAPSAWAGAPPGVAEDAAPESPDEAHQGGVRDLPGDVHAVVDREREMVEFWRGKYAELVEQRECEGQQHLGEVAG